MKDKDTKSRNMKIIQEAEWLELDVITQNTHEEVDMAGTMEVVDEAGEELTTRRSTTIEVEEVVEAIITKIEVEEVLEEAIEVLEEAHNKEGTSSSRIQMRSTIRTRARKTTMASIL